MHQTQVEEPFATGYQLWGEWARKGEEFIYKCSGINSGKVKNSLVDRQQDCTFISFENAGIHQRELLHISKSIWSLPFQQTNCNVCRIRS